MKIYIRSNNAETIETHSMTIEIEMIVDPSYLNIAAVTDRSNIPLPNRSIPKDITDEYDEVVAELIRIVESFGYVELEKHKSNQSNSIYITFCRESEYERQEVTLVARLRVSDHDLPRWKKDTSQHDAESRLMNDARGFVQDNSFLNTRQNGLDTIKYEPIIVKYENEFYTTYNDVFKKVQDKISKFRNKFG